MANAKTTAIFTTERALTRLRESVHAKASNFYAMYSSVLGGIVTDPALMVLPLDDHMVHRGHAVFDTATLTHGMLYQLDPHLDRLIRSADGARIPLPFPASACARYFGNCGGEPPARRIRALLAIRRSRRLRPRSGGMRRQQLLRDRLQAGSLPGELLSAGHQAHHQPGADQATALRSHQVDQLFTQRARRVGSQRPWRRQRRFHRSARHGRGKLQHERSVRDQRSRVPPSALRRNPVRHHDPESSRFRPDSRATRRAQRRPSRRHFGRRGSRRGRNDAHRQLDQSRARGRMGRTKNR